MNQKMKDKLTALGDELGVLVEQFDSVDIQLVRHAVEEFLAEAQNQAAEWMAELDEIETDWFESVEEVEAAPA